MNYIFVWVWKKRTENRSNVFFVNESERMNGQNTNKLIEITIELETQKDKSVCEWKTQDP